MILHQVGYGEILASRVKGLEDEIGVILVSKFDENKLKAESLVTNREELALLGIGLLRLRLKHVLGLIVDVGALNELLYAGGETLVPKRIEVVAHCCKEERQGSKALLAVDHKQGFVRRLGFVHDK